MLELVCISQRHLLICHTIFFSFFFHMNWWHFLVEIPNSNFIIQYLYCGGWSFFQTAFLTTALLALTSMALFRHVSVGSKLLSVWWNEYMVEGNMVSVYWPVVWRSVTKSIPNLNCRKSVEFIPCFSLMSLPCCDGFAATQVWEVYRKCKGCYRNVC